MNRLLLMAALSVVTGCSMVAQSGRPNASLESEIKALSVAEVDAVLRRDIAALDRIWADDFLVNGPNNQILRGKAAALELVRSGLIHYSSFVRRDEAVMIREGVVIIMGEETVTPTGNAPGAGQTIRRRVTNVWINNDGRWELTARQATIIEQR